MKRYWVLAAAAVAAAALLATHAGAQGAHADTQRSRTAQTAGKPTDEELRQRLTPLQYHVTQKAGTEPAFSNEYWDNHRPGIYVDIVSGEVLFSSLDKYESGTGWPSFTKPLVPGNVRTKADYRTGFTAKEVRSTRADSHLGHVFDDGPPPLGTRYCMNSAAMRFIPADRLAQEGYPQYGALFEKTAGKDARRK